MFPWLQTIRIQGYRPFRDFSAQVGALEVLVGANGAGKSSLFEFLKFLRDSVHQDIPPEIIAGAIGQQVFHRPGRDSLEWDCIFDFGQSFPLRYQGVLLGPVGRTHITSERIATVPSSENHNAPYLFMDIRERQGIVNDTVNKQAITQQVELKRPNQLALSAMTNPALMTLYNLREYIGSWRFYSAFNIHNSKIRKSVPTEQEPTLHEDAGNLSAVLFYLMTEYPVLFDTLQQHLRSVVPGFRGLKVKARGGPGEVIAFWQENGFDDELSLADLSDGILRLICWIVLCVHPKPPTLICIDEPDQGVHPRTLPILAGLLNKASERTQVFVATHASYFLMQFDISHIAVLRKENGEAKFYKPSNSQILMDNLSDFGSDELEVMHRSDELERLA